MRTGPNRRVGRGADGGDGLRHRDHGRERQRRGQPPEIRRSELVDQVVQPDLRQRGDERVDDQRDQSGHAERPERHPPQLRELGKLDPGRRGAGLPQVLEIPVLGGDRVPGLAFGHRGLQEGQHLLEGDAPQPGEGGRGGSFRPRRQRRRHQGLGRGR
ncbi:MAG TPA: hypothetical protein VGW74_21235 [Propionibacteriaceae bacterium]|nr:hypothetical protein [Propionibacteriaceae bacterium]